MNNETITSLEQQRMEIDAERAELAQGNMRVSAEMSRLNVEFRSNKTLPTDKYRRLLRQQDELKQEQSSNNLRLSDLNVKRARINTLIEACKREVKAESAPSDIRAKLTELRDKYRAFSSDATRVSSMRLMASQFADDLEKLASLKG